MAFTVLTVKNKVLKHPAAFFQALNISSNAVRQKLEYKKNCEILGVSENSDQEQIRAAYLKLVKKYHPDSGNEEANADKFYEIDKAFKMLMHKKSQERWEVEEENFSVQEQNIKHTAPQHRQYLSYDGYGHGNPFQRQKQYTKLRAFQASENVLQHRISRVTADEKTLWNKVPLKHKIKTKYGFDRLVEDLIQESMSKGEFSNLSGVGKPLKNVQSRNPYVDFVTHKLNEVLIDNGFTPEWILLQKEIREDAQNLRNDLISERSYFGPYPLSREDRDLWTDAVSKYEEATGKINNKIDKFNLVVPIINKQMVHVCLKKEAEKALVLGKNYEQVGHNRTKEEQAHTNVILELTQESLNLQQQILEDLRELRKGLYMERTCFGKFPLSIEDNISWSEVVYKYENLVRKINRKIDKLNVAFRVNNIRLLYVSLKNEAQKAIVLGKSCDNEDEENLLLINDNNNNCNNVSTNVNDVINRREDVGFDFINFIKKIFKT